MTLAEILATFPVGSDERLEALAAWRQAQDQVAVKERDTKPAVPKRTAPPKPKAEPLSHVAGAADEQRRMWEDRKAAAERQREAEAAAAIRARVTKAVELTCARLSAVTDPKFRQAKMLRLAEIQASLAANKDPKTLAIISQSFSEIEARLARLTAE
jgi:hypothetical protein